MTPDEFSQALAAIGWSRGTLSTLLGCSPNLPYAWGRGVTPIPPAVAKWLGALAREHDKRPPPKDWRMRAARS